MQEAYQLSQSDRVLQKKPFSFDVSVWEFFWPLITGARLVIARPGGHQDTRYFFFNDTAPTEISTLSLHDALPISVSTACPSRSNPSPTVLCCKNRAWIPSS